MCIRDRYSTLNRSLVPALEKAGLHVIFEHEAFSEKQKEFVDRYFEDNVYPVLTPMAMDSSRPFPLIRNKTLNLSLIHIYWKSDSFQLSYNIIVRFSRDFPRILSKKPLKKETGEKP